MTELEKAKAEIKKEMEKVLPVDGSPLVWARKMVAVYYHNKSISPMWREIAEKNGIIGLVQETLDKVLSAAEFAADTDSDKKAVKRTLDSGTFLYHADFVRCLNLVLSGKIK